VIRQPPAATLVSGEHAQLQQVLLNLCRNAANAMPDGGRIEVATAFDEISETRALSHGELGPGQYVCIAVTDTGQGMDEMTLGRIFEPFFTTRSSGNGLGLATVGEIVRDHRGAMNVHSKPGEGSRFEVWLPRAATAEQASEPSTTAHPAGTGETIMLVAQDSERLLRDEEMLAALGYEPVGFSSSDPPRGRSTWRRACMRRHRVCRSCWRPAPRSKSAPIRWSAPAFPMSCAGRSSPRRSRSR
jgi:hypothetical protein